jgi:hypothetical protein
MEVFALVLEKAGNFALVWDQNWVAVITPF